MSEDTAQLDTDGAQIWRDPSGIVALGDGGQHYDLDHGITVICDSRRGRLTRLIIRREAARKGRPRIMCPAGCGRMATVYIHRSEQQ